MKDRFKFRYAYENMVYDVRQIDFTYNYIVLGNKRTLDFPISDGELLQCTGLKDKNGTLIYEGDIVKYTSKPSKTNPEKEPYTENFKVVWDGISYVSQRANGVNCQNVAIEQKQLEVIGNIYENPELLEVNND